MIIRAYEHIGEWKQFIGTTRERVLLKKYVII